MGEDDQKPALSLWRGGLFYKLASLVPFLRKHPFDALRRSLVLALLAWAPPILMVFERELVTGAPHTMSFQITHHVRWWVTVPLLFVAETLVESRLPKMTAYLRESGIISGESERALGGLERQVTNVCHSVLLEVVLLALAFASSLPALRAAPDAAHIWLAAVTMPLARFLVLRWVQRWLFWTFLLVQISRLKLELNGLHPDRAGGLSVLVLPSRALSIVFAGLGSVMAAELAQGLAPGESLTPHAPQIATWAGLCVLIASAPFASFSPKMISVKRLSLKRYAVFGQSYVQDFAARWLHRPADSPLGSADIQSLADLGGSYDALRGMRLVPIPRDFVIEMVIAALLPVVPVYVHTMSMTALVTQLVKIVF